VKSEIRPSRSLEKSVQITEYSEYLETINHEIAIEVERIIAEEELLGEGRAAKVFEVSVPSSSCPVCIKIWRPEILLMAQTDPLEYHKRQFHKPIEEFDLQDEIYSRRSVATPKPIAFGHIEGHVFMAMEQIKGHTLQEIIKAGAKIPSTVWDSIQLEIIKLHRECGVVHRDLHGGNIMIETDEPLVEGVIISGRVFIIDFGLSCHVVGDPTREDYELTIGNNSVRYTNDFSYLDEIKPMKPGSPFIKGTR